MNGIDNKQLNKIQIEQHLKSAISTLTPDILGKIDLTTPQEIFIQPSVSLISRRLRVVTGAVAACIGIMLLTGGGVYAYQNGRVDSVIGIDVNPSIELSVNRRNKVLAAEPLNNDAVEIIDNMELKGVDLNIAVNAVIGSMVQHGYLDDLDNAILVTVSNDSISKADSLRHMVVGDIQSSLAENRVEAVVYDQQAVPVDGIKQLAEQYGISYGKAYFLKELIDQNPTLTAEDMEGLAPLTMEEIAREISDGSYAMAGKDDNQEASKTTTASTTAPETTLAETTVPESATAALAAGTPPTSNQTSHPTTSAPEVTQAPPSETAQEVVEEGSIKIDNVDYDLGVVNVDFENKVKWSNPTVSVKDEDGNAYSAMVGDYDSTYCAILVSGLEDSRTYTFVLGGVRRSSGGKATTVKGTFETPVISEDATETSKDEQPQNPDPEVPAETTPVPETKPQPTEGQTESAASPPETHPSSSSAVSTSGIK